MEIGLNLHWLLIQVVVTHLVSSNRHSPLVLCQLLPHFVVGLRMLLALRGISRDVSNKTKSLSSRWTEPASSLTIASSIVKEFAKTEANDSTEIPEESVNNRQVAIDSLPFASPWLAGAIPQLSHTDQPKEAMSRNHDSATSVAK